MKRILFVINSLAIGGSEKSLVSLLNLIDYSKYEVDLLMLKKGEPFDKYIPQEVNILDIPDYYRFLTGDSKNINLYKKTLYMISRYKSSIELRLNGKLNKKINNQQIFYRNQKRILDKLSTKYDVAIAYAQGFPTYFVAEKVESDKKLAWINCDYTATLYDKDLDKKFYDRIDNIIAVSESGKKSIVNVNNDYEGKIKIIKDIVNPNLIKEMAEESIGELDEEEINILTVARIVKGYKGYDLAVKAAGLLKDEGYKFKWYAIGDGPDKEQIEELIKENNVEDEFVLLGSRDNPYPYMKKCNIYVQPSRVEGFGLTVAEAKILRKPIVCTNFRTAKELINNNIDGLIVNINEKSISDGIKMYMENRGLKGRIINNLNNNEPYTTMGELDKIYKLADMN